MLTRSSLMATLATGVFDITFTKVSGEIKTTRGTLQPQFLPVTAPLAEGEAPKSKKAINESLVNFYDLSVNEWRSFKIDGIQAINLVLNYTPSVATAEQPSDK